MTARERGDWIPWYCEDSPGWVELSFAARGVAEGIARKMGPKRNALYLGHRGLRGLCRLLHGRWEEFEPAMRELLSTGPDGEPPRLVYDAETGTLSDPQHEDRRRRSVADRVADHRAKKRQAGSAPISEPPPDVTPVTDVTPSNGGNSPSPLLSSDLISSSRKGEPERGPPDWFREVVEAVCADTGEKFAVHEAWIRYSGHRATVGKAINAQDARYWLGTVMVPEARKERRNESDRRLNQQRRDGPPERPKQSREDARREAQEFAAQLAARNKGAA